MEFESVVNNEPFDNFLLDAENANFSHDEIITSPENNNANAFSESNSNYFSSDLDSGTPNLDDGNLLHVNLRHKPKHARGEFETIAADQSVRVTSGRGKHMQLVVISGVDCDWRTFRVSYVSDIVGQNDQSDDFVIKLEKMYATQTGQGNMLKYQLTADIQLIARSKANNRMHLLIELASIDGTILEARSVSFKTSESSSSKREPQAKKRKLNELGDSESINVQAHSPTVVDVSHIHNVDRTVPQPQPPVNISYPQSNNNINIVPAPNVQPFGDNSMAIVMPSSLDVHGIVRARGFYQFSDLRLKTNVEEIVGALQTITRLNGVRYQWRPNIPQTNYRGSSEKVIGLIAQEVQRVFPELVRQENDGYLSVNYTDLIPVMIEAMKELSRNQQDAQGELLALRMTMEDVVVHLSVTKKGKDFEEEEDRMTLARLNKYKRMRDQVTYELNEKQLVLATVDKFGERLKSVETQTTTIEDTVKKGGRKRCNLSRRMFKLLLAIIISFCSMVVIMVVVLTVVLNTKQSSSDTPSVTPITTPIAVPI